MVAILPEHGERFSGNKFISGIPTGYLTCLIFVGLDGRVTRLSEPTRAEIVGELYERNLSHYRVLDAIHKLDESTQTVIIDLNEVTDEYKLSTWTDQD